MLNGLPREAPTLNEDATADVLVVGGGITGALVADALATAGCRVLLLEARACGTGSTAASTALLQYEIDVPLTSPCEKLGSDRAVRAYHCLVQAVDEIAKLIHSLDDDCALAMRSSIYLASKRADRKALEMEASLRQRVGIPCEYREAKLIRDRYGFPSYGALLNHHSAEVDPVRFTASLLRRAVLNGATINARTRVESITGNVDGIVATTDAGHRVRARYAVMATGYETVFAKIKSYYSLHSTFAIVTDPLKRLGKWDDGSLVWESNRPYFYMRTSADGRIIAGGEDVKFRAPAPRDAALPGKALNLGKKLRKMLSDVEVTVAHSWAGTFAETNDGLPLIGEHPTLPSILFALGYGGNGITFSAIAAAIIRDRVKGNASPDAALFGFERLEKARAD